MMRKFCIWCKSPIPGRGLKYCSQACGITARQASYRGKPRRGDQAVRNERERIRKQDPAVRERCRAYDREYNKRPERIAAQRERAKDPERIEQHRAYSAKRTAEKNRQRQHLKDMKNANELKRILDNLHETKD